MITHHPPHEMIVEYANGSLPEAESLLVASHASMCAACREEISALEDIGGGLLESGEEAPVAEDALAHVLARIDRPEPEPAAAPIEFDIETRRTVPPPLRPLLAGSLAALHWRRLGRGLRQADLPDYGGGRVSLLEIRASQKVAAHTHTGNEYTLVLRGGYRDGDAHYVAGDIAVADPSIDHAPVADDDGSCLCVTIRDGRTRLTGPVGRLFNPFVRD